MRRPSLHHQLCFRPLREGRRLVNTMSASSSSNSTSQQSAPTSSSASSPMTVEAEYFTRSRRGATNTVKTDTLISTTSSVGVVKCKARRVPAHKAHDQDIRTELVRYSILDTGSSSPFSKDSAFQEVENFRRTLCMNREGATTTAFEANQRATDRALGSFVGMGLGDALGAPLEFTPVRYPNTGGSGRSSDKTTFLKLLPKFLRPTEYPYLTELGDPRAPRGRFDLEHGQWTDDAAMGLCIADSLLQCQSFDPQDMKERLVSWWQFGYNNSSRLAETPRPSTDLGGNVGEAFHEFLEQGTIFTTTGNKNTSGSGSLIRNGAIPCFFHGNFDKMLSVSRQQSLLTHQGEEARELCAALSFLVHFALTNPKAGKDEILRSLEGFKTSVPSVHCLANSWAEPGGSEDRDWNWRIPHQYRYSPTRAAATPSWIGSYAMDGMAMALHCVHRTDSFSDALLLAANMGGDADSVCAITGQIAGSIYGYSAVPEKWVEVFQRWDGNEFAAKAWKLYHRT